MLYVICYMLLVVCCLFVGSLFCFSIIDCYFRGNFAMIEDCPHHTLHTYKW